MRYLFIILAITLVSCSSSSKLATSASVTVEQDRVVNYYLARDTAARYPLAGGSLFSPSFYQISDSVRASFTSNDAPVFGPIYARISAERSHDSTYHGASDYFARLARALGNNFDLSKGGRK